MLTRRQIVTELKKIGWTLKRKFWNPPNTRNYKGIAKSIKDQGMIGLPLRAAAAIEEMMSSDILE
jgi:hypothetical protein